MTSARDQLRIGLLINPVAGIGGATALKGSDGAAIQARAAALGGSGRGLSRAVRFLRAVTDAPLSTTAAQLLWHSWDGAMGAAAFAELNGSGRNLALTVHGAPTTPSNAADTRAATAALQALPVDLLVFFGGDGTARDLFDVCTDKQLVLGVPAGVKMHSGVFATTPEAAAAIVRDLASGEIVNAQLAEVRDMDENQRRAGILKTITYGEMRIPAAGGYVQQTKEGGKENESLALEEIVAQVLEHAEGQLVIGPGSSCARIKEALGMQPTLLGVDVWADGQQFAQDVDAQWLLEHAPAPSQILLSFIRGQGFLLGRGNQQLSAPWLSAWLGQDQNHQLTIISTRSKLASLAGRPLLVDTDDPALNARLCGLHRVTVGYDDELWYRVAQHG